MASGSDRESGGTRRRPVPLRDVALASGVSVATASKALNDQGRMTAETRARIQDTARQLASVGAERDPFDLGAAEVDTDAHVDSVYPRPPPCVTLR